MCGTADCDFWKGGLVMSAAHDYLLNIQQVLAEAYSRNEEALESAAHKIVDCITNEGLLYLFGTGHAHMMAEEIFYRAGGLAAVYPILDERLMLHIDATGSTEAERTPGYAAM